MDSITLFVFLLCTLTAEVNCEGKWVMFFVGLFLSSLHLGDSQRSRIYLKTNNHVRQKGFKEQNIADILESQEMPLFRVFGEKKNEICFSLIS